MEAVVEKWHDLGMTLNIEDTETERLAAEVAGMTGESKAEAVRQALRERKARMELLSGRAPGPRPDLQTYLETEIWPHIPEDDLDQPPLSKAEVEEMLGFGPDGY